jgi:leader peptidase (prepilin peptidase) / N-methyltransferase
MIEAQITVAFFFFVLGAVSGSFVNVLIWRLPRRESIVFPGSHCPTCDKKIKFYDNIPIISWIILGGKCRFCHTKISPRYLAVETFVALAYLATFLIYGPDRIVDIIRMILLIPIFVAITLIDWEHWVIPDELVISVAAIGIASAPFLGGWQFLIEGIIGAAGGALFFWIIAFAGKKIFKKEALGDGDILLIGALGFVLGWQEVILTIFLSATLASIAGIIIMGRNKKPKTTDNVSYIPYGPFIIVASLIAVSFGDIIIRLYLSVLM